MSASQEIIYPDDVTLIRARPEYPATISVGNNDTLSYGTTSSLGSTLAAGQSMTVTADTYIQTAANGAVLVVRYEPWDVQEHDEEITDTELALNVKEFGARGDGTADDSTAIQEAITACNAAGGGVVFFPEGTYELGTKLTLSSSVELRGTGASSVLNLPANDDAVYGSSVDDVRVTNLKFVGNGGTSDDGNGIYLLSATRVLVTGCYFTNMATSASGGAGCVFNGCARTVFTHNTGLDAGYALVNHYNTTDFAAVGNVHRNTRAAGTLSTCIYANTNSSDGVIVGNASQDDTYPIEVRVGAKRITVVGNEISGCKNQGIVVQSENTDLVSHVVVANNVVELAAAATDGIFVDSTTHVTVKGNIVQGAATSAGILVTDAGTQTNGTDNTVEGNIVRSSAEYGIRVIADCVRAQVIGNRVETTDDQRGISVEAADCTVQNNYVYDAGFHAVSVTGDDCLITANRIKTTRNNGIGITYSGDGGEVSNNLISNTTGAAMTLSGTGVKRHGNKVSGGESQGRAVLVGGTVTVSTTEVLAADNIHLTRIVSGGTEGHLSVGTITADTSFVINSSSGTDTSTVFWEIVH